MFRQFATRSAVILTEALIISTASAQQPSTPESTPATGLATSAGARLTVRPHTMATGTRIDSSGLHRLRAAKDYWVYIPTQCIGTRRVPLVVYLGGAGVSAMDVLDQERQFADRYGMMLLLPTAVSSQAGMWDFINGWNDGRLTYALPDSAWPRTVLHYTDTNQDEQNLDAALKEALRTYAIDPDKIALAGFSNGGSFSLFLGRYNSDVFSRIAPLSAVFPLGGDGPRTPTTQYFLSGGIAEDMAQTVVALSAGLQQQGYPVTTVIGLRNHVDLEADDAYMWQWLSTSWTPGHTIPTAIARASVDSDPLLTVATLQHMTTFWTRFAAEPDSIKTVARMAHQTPVALQLGKQLVSVVKANIRDLAARYPSVAADLAAAGLTAHEEERYREAILRVGFTRLVTAPGTGDSGTPNRKVQMATTAVGPIVPTSVLGQNLAFRAAHAQEFKALAHTGMWTLQ